MHQRFLRALLTFSCLSFPILCCNISIAFSPFNSIIIKFNFPGGPTRRALLSNSGRRYAKQDITWKGVCLRKVQRELRCLRRRNTTIVSTIFKATLQQFSCFGNHSYSVQTSHTVGFPQRNSESSAWDARVNSKRVDGKKSSVELTYTWYEFAVFRGLESKNEFRIKFSKTNIRKRP